MHLLRRLHECPSSLFKNRAWPEPGCPVLRCSPGGFPPGTQIPLISALQLWSSGQLRDVESSQALSSCLALSWWGGRKPQLAAIEPVRSGSCWRLPASWQPPLKFPIGGANLQALSFSHRLEGRPAAVAPHPPPISYLFHSLDPCFPAFISSG